ncbi:uncharacterized protein LOC122364605, partial [Amphibalanus amphitrite]|uniref:uncharacterized protein LOC122364605 n=1 Tax=Amphibalanus amphitrite TaxID=1232801 RepID=UPI001C92AA01
CVCLLSFKWKGRIFGGWKSYLIIVLIWLYGFLTQGLSIFGVYGKYGWSDETHKCDFLNTTPDTQPRSNWFLISWSIPCVIIVVSYSLIFIKVKQSGRSILMKNHSMDYVQALVKTREDKTSRMIFVVFITYCVCVLPITVMNVADPENCYPYLSLVFYCVYWLQYCCNNVIYVMSNSVYRQAYIIFLTEVCPPLKRFLHQPAPWQAARQSTVTTIAGFRSQSTHSVLEAARRLRHADSVVSQTAVSGDSVSRDGPPSSPSSPPTASSESPGSESSCRMEGGVARRVGPRKTRPPPPRRSVSLERCCEDEVTFESEQRPPLTVRLRRRLAGRRRSLPLEKPAGPLPAWWALDDSTWLWYYCDTIAATVSRRLASASERRPHLDKRSLFSRKRSMSF